MSELSQETFDVLKCVQPKMFLCSRKLHKLDTKSLDKFTDLSIQLKNQIWATFVFLMEMCNRPIISFSGWWCSSLKLIQDAKI